MFWSFMPSGNFQKNVILLESCNMLKSGSAVLSPGNVTIQRMEQHLDGKYLVLYRVLNIIYSYHDVRNFDKDTEHPRFRPVKTTFSLCNFYNYYYDYGISLCIK